METAQKREIGTFFLILILFGTVTSYLRSDAYSAPRLSKLVFGLVHMWGPGIAAIAAKLIHRGNLRSLGWKLGKPRFLLLAYFAPLILSLIAYGVVWLTGLGGVSVDGLAGLIREGAPFLEGSPVFMLFLALAVVGLFRNLIAATGEEIGWTGFLTPAFLEIASPAKTSLAVGLIWALWHYPIILFAEYNVGTTAWLAIPFFTIMIIGFSFIRTWLWMGSASLWTGAVLHASHNLFVQAFFDNLTVDFGGTKLLTTEFGCVTALVYAAAGVFILSSVKKRSQRTRFR